MTDPVGASAPSPQPDLLAAADAAFARGDYAEVRAACARIPSDAPPELRGRAAALLRRVSPDPIEIGVILACATFLLFVILGWVYPK